MSLSGVFGISEAAASPYTCGSFLGSMATFSTPRPFFSSEPSICPTLTPATVTGLPRPGVTASTWSNSRLIVRRSASGDSSRCLLRM